VGNVLSRLGVETNSVLLRADIVSGRLAFDGVRRSSDASVLTRGADTEVGSGSLNSVLSGDTAKRVARSLVGLLDLGATVKHRRCLGNSLAINEVDIRSLVREFGALGSEAGSGVFGTESGSLHAEGASSCLVLETSLVEAELATWAVDAELGLGGLESEVNLGSLVLVRSVVLAEASRGGAADSLLEATNSASGARAKRSESCTSTESSDSISKVEIGTAWGNDGVAESARSVRGSTIVLIEMSSSVASIAWAAVATVAVTTRISSPSSSLSGESNNTSNSEHIVLL